ncbi:MAG: DUF1579 family protein [Planctomycetota bacterium]
MNTTLALVAVPAALAIGFVAGRTSVATEAHQPAALVQDGQDGSEPAMDEMTMRLTQPGDHHAVLGVFVGDWDATVTMWDPRSPEPSVETGTMHAEWIMGGRFLKQNFSATIMGMPFEGMGLMGYSGGEQVYESVWVDNMVTDLAYGSGYASADGLSLTSLSSEIDWETGRPRDVEERTQIVSKDEISYERWYPATDGGEDVRSMRIVYKRRAGTR